MTDQAKTGSQAAPPLYGKPINWGDPLKVGLFYIAIPIPAAFVGLVNKLDLIWENRRVAFEKSAASKIGGFQVRLLPSSWIDLETLKKTNFKSLKYSLTGKKPGYVYCKRKWYDAKNSKFYVYVVISNG